MGLEKKEMEEMEGLSAEKEEMPASTNVDNLIEISLKWKVQMKLSYDIRYVFRLENLLNIVESDKALINSCYDILSTPKVFDHLG